MTYACESWMSKLRKFVPKRFHACRYYNLGVWMAVLDHNENVDRHVRGERWARGESVTDSVDASREKAVRDALDDVISSVVAAAASPWRKSRA